MPAKHVYKITFINQGKVYEIYASNVGQAGMLGFIEVSGLLFGEKSSVVLDPNEESLRNEFKRVKSTYIPMHSILRIDEVEKQGTAKVTRIESKGDDKITPFPMPIYTPGGGTGKS